MKKIWFRRKRYGYGWTPATWQGWLALAVYVAVVVYLCISTFAVLHPTRTTILFIILTILLIVISYVKGEKPRWQWGTDTARPSDTTPEKQG